MSAQEIVGSSDFTIGLRPIDIKGQEPTQLVAYMEAELKMSGSRAFFDFLVTPEGQQAITAGDALKEAAARAAGLKCVTSHSFRISWILRSLLNGLA